MLAALGTGTAGSAPVVQADDHYIERPFIVEENGVKITLYDCARTVVEASRLSGGSTVEINVGFVSAEGVVDGEMLLIENPEYPYEFVANCHLDEWGVNHGSAAIDNIAVLKGTERLAELNHPYEQDWYSEWDCGEVRRQEVDPWVLEEYC